MPPVFGKDAIYFLERRQWLISGMLSNSFSWSFLKELWALSLVFPWVSLFYFLQTLERLPPKYAGFNGHLYFSQIVFRSCSSTYKNSLTYFCSGFLFRDITSKMLKNVSFFFPLSFLSHTLVSFRVQPANGCFSCVANFFILQCQHSLSLKFLSNSGKHLFQFDL